MKNIILCVFMLPMFALAKETNAPQKKSPSTMLQKSPEAQKNGHYGNNNRPNRPHYNINVHINPQPYTHYNSRETIYFGGNNGSLTREHWESGNRYYNENNNNNGQCIYRLKDSKKTERHPKEEDWEWLCPR